MCVVAPKQALSCTRTAVNPKIVSCSQTCLGPRRGVSFCFLRLNIVVEGVGFRRTLSVTLAALRPWRFKENDGIREHGRD